MKKKDIIKEVKKIVKDKLENEGSGHDYYHIMRVYNNALHIAKEEEGADIFVVELASLLHDIADHKFGYDDEDRKRIIKGYLEEYQVDKNIIDHVVDIANTISFKDKNNKVKMKSLEGEIVQDADRLDAIGAIGIARAFTFGGNFQRLIYDPESDSKEDTISHFYEKLLLLKDRMNTRTGKKIADKRHKYMEEYLNQFYDEWAGKK